MPNWVDNSLTIQGPAEDLARFAEQARKPYEHFGGDTRDEVISFWNFIKPDDNILDEYWGQAPQYPDLATALRHEGNHWYDWNVRNWGCKWDAKEAHVEESVGELMYWFDTPWGPPTEALEEMSKQYPTLVLTMRSIEEQGWGCEYIADQDGVRLIEEWDIPETHEDSMEHKGYCNCEENDELDYLYDDCPKKMEAVNV